MVSVPDPDRVLVPPSPAGRDALRLLVTPLLIAGVWLAESFLLGGSTGLFRAPDPIRLFAYTIVACILTGIVLPVLVLPRSFLSGAVTMHQIGFRSPRRTITLSTLAGALLLLLFMFFPPAATAAGDRLLPLFLLLLPTGIASVMICWVLVGTHLQALVRQGGVLVAVTTGVVITALLFALSLRIHLSPAGSAGTIIPALLLGVAAALLFFSIRDVYATTLILSGGMVYLIAGAGGATLPESLQTAAAACAALSFLALIGVHTYFSRRYATVRIVPDR